MKTLCFSVRLKEMVRVTDKAYKAIAFDGSSAIIPVSQVFGRDFSSQKSESWWISAWILEKKDLQYSIKKNAMFDNNTRQRLPDIIIEKHCPEYVQPLENNILPDLKSE